MRQIKIIFSGDFPREEIFCNLEQQLNKFIKTHDVTKINWDGDSWIFIVEYELYEDRPPVNTR